LQDELDDGADGSDAILDEIITSANATALTKY
jgi:hypothetical protein